jgi:Sulfotransferase family
MSETAMSREPGRTLLFLVGLWRSGTSLLQGLLNRHSGVALMYEAEPFALWPRRANARWPADWPERLECYNQAISRHRLAAAALRSRRLGREAALGLYEGFGAQRGASVIGEKAPAYYAWLPEIARMFPEARFLVIWRDPLECCRSAARAGRSNRFFAQRGMMTRILFGAEALARGVERLQQEGRNVQELVYGELVANPEAQLRRVCRFLDICFEARMLDLKGADLSVLPTGEHHDRVRSGVIGQTSAEPDPMPACFKAKAQRYSARWRERFPQLGLGQALSPSPERCPPGWAEQWADRGAKGVFSQMDEFKRQVFRRIPLNWWNRLRSATPRAQAPRTVR